MNSYNQRVCQNQSELCQMHKSQTSSARMIHISRKTNTPPEFLVCQQCQQMMGKKLNPMAVQMTIGDCGVGFSEYTKALNYINSCHRIINKMINQIQNANTETSQILSMPNLPNFIDLFSSIQNIKQNLQEQEVNAPNCNSVPETLKNYEVCDSVENSDDKAQRQLIEQQKATYRLENYLFANSKQNEDQKVTYISRDNKYSATTTENEDSEEELDLPQQKILIPSKFKPVTLQNKKENVIYEGIYNRDRDSRCNNQSKQNLGSEFSAAQAKKSSNISERIKNPPPRTQEVNYMTTLTNVAQRRVKPRSASVRPNSYLSREEKKKDSFELNANRSDTALSIKNAMKSNNKGRDKSPVQSVSFGPNLNLSQKELDKYTKELLRSRLTSTRSSSRNIAPKQPMRPKTEDRSKMQLPKTAGVNKSKQVDVKNRPKSYQERQTHLSKCQPVQTQTVVMQQNGSKRYKNVCTAISNHKTITEGQQTDEYLLKNTPTPILQNAGFSRPQNTTYLHSSTVTNLHSSGKTNMNVCPPIVCPTHSVKMPHEDYLLSIQKRIKSFKNTGSRTHIETNCRTKSPSKTPETHQSIAQMNHQLISRSRGTCPECSNGNNPEDDAQFSVMAKSNDYHTVHQTCNHHQRKLTNSNYVYKEESDDIKTDSDADDDHYINEETDKKSTFDPHIKEMLTNVVLFSDGQVSPEINQLKMEAKSLNANDERNYPFQKPRRTLPEVEASELARISDRVRQNIYESATMTNLDRAQSEESSDIKSDNEDDYLNCNHYSANQYRQT